MISTKFLQRLQHRLILTTELLILVLHSSLDVLSNDIKYGQRSSPQIHATNPKASSPLKKYPSPPSTSTHLTTSDQRIQKRPLLHPPIAPPRAGSSVQKIVYVSASSPFIAVIKRVRKLLSHIEARAARPITFAARNQRDILRQIEDGVSGRGNGGKGAREEEVVLKATGKAIEKLLGLVLHFQGESDVKVVVRTGSVGAVDDIVNKEGADGEEEGSQVRRTSTLEVGISLR